MSNNDNDVYDPNVPVPEPAAQPAVEAPSRVDAPLATTGPAVPEMDNRPYPESKKDKSRTDPKDKFPARQILENALTLINVMSRDQPRELVGGVGDLEEPELQDVTYIPNFAGPRNRTAWLRAEVYSVVDRFRDQLGQLAIGPSFCDQHLVDSCNLVMPESSGVEVSAAWIQLSQLNLLEQPQGARSSIINPVIRSPMIAAWLAQQTRVNATEVAWFLRMIAMSWNVVTAVTEQSLALVDAFLGRRDMPVLDLLESVRFTIPAERLRQIPAVYCTSSQFVDFMTNRRANQWNWRPEDIGGHIAVVPLLSTDSGAYLIQLGMAACDTVVWNTWAGVYATRHTQVGPPARHTYQVFYPKATKTRIPGPLGGVLYVFVEETSELGVDLGPRDLFQLGAAATRVQNIQSPNQTCNLAGIYLRRLGHGFVGGPAIQLPVGTLEDEWLAAFHWLQDHMNAGGAERKAYAMAAELFVEFQLSPQRTDAAPVAPAALEVARPGRTRGRAEWRNRLRVGMHALNPPVPAADIMPMVAGEFDRAVGWTAQKKTDRHAYTLVDYPVGAGYDQHQVIPDGVAHKWVPYNELRDGNVDSYERQVLMRASPNGQLRGGESPSHVTNEYEPNLVEVEGVQIPIAIPDIDQWAGLPRFNVPTSDWCSRLMQCIGAYEPVGRAMNWTDAAAMHCYIRMVGFVTAAAVSSVIVAAGLTWTRWAGVLQPVPRHDYSRPDSVQYDALRSAGFGKMVPTQEQLVNGVGVRLLQQYPQYLRADGRLDRYDACHFLRDDAGFVLNKWCSANGVELSSWSVETMSWVQQQRYGMNYGGHASTSVVPNYMEFNLAAMSTDFSIVWPRWRVTHPTEPDVTDEWTTGCFEDTPMIMCTGQHGDFGIVVPERCIMRSVMHCHGIEEEYAANGTDLCQLLNPVVVSTSGPVRVELAWPDPRWWDWLWERATTVGRSLIEGNWVRALADAVTYLVRDISTHIRTGRPAWEAHQEGGANAAGGDQVR